MQKQSFIAPNISAALLLVKESLGADAIILSTERQPGGGIKITAAIEQGAARLSSSRPKPPTKPSAPAVKPLDIELIRKGLDYHGILPFVSNKIITEAQKEAAKPQFENTGKTLSKVFDNLFRYYDILEASTPFKMFMGICGSGKSACIAKVATQSKLKNKQSCIISTDNRRAGANIQLKAFADILETPFYIAESARSLYTKLQELKNRYDFILIDTPGINPFIKQDIELLQTYAEVTSAQMIMTLDAGKNAADAVEIADIFSGLGVDCLFPTRMDLSRRMGSIFSIAGSVGLKLGAGGTGISIAEGIGRINSASLSRLILSPYSDKRR